MPKVEFYNHHADVVDFVLELLRHQYLIEDYSIVSEYDGRCSGFFEFYTEDVDSEALAKVFDRAETYLRKEQRDLLYSQYSATLEDDYGNFH